METKDRELQHHVLFSFKNYHDLLSKIETWLKMSDEIKEVYTGILKKNVFECKEVVQNSWRYYMTYLKVMESLIDSSYKHND